LVALLAVIAVLSLVPTPAMSQSIGVTYGVLTVADTAVGIPAAKLVTPEGEKVSLCRLSVLTAPITYMYHGETPTASTGHPANATDTLTVTGYTNLVQFLAIRSTSTSAEIRYTCER
jgi:hypothetical protein